MTDTDLDARAAYDWPDYRLWKTFSSRARAEAAVAAGIACGDISPAARPSIGRIGARHTVSLIREAERAEARA